MTAEAEEIKDSRKAVILTLHCFIQHIPKLCIFVPGWVRVLVWVSAGFLLKCSNTDVTPKIITLWA